MIGLRRLLPKTLFVRGMWIVVLPVLFLQMATIYFFFERHLDNVSRYARQALVGEVSFLAYLIANKDSRGDALTYLFQSQTGTYAEFRAGAKMPKPLPPHAFPALEKNLKQNIDLPLYVTRRKNNIEIGIAYADGMLILQTTVKRIENQTADIFLWWMSGAGVLFLCIAILFLRNQIRPIKELADVAERFGKGQDIGNFKPSGATEVRRAGRAFMVMRERIQRQVKTRTEMLAGISHDLRTPLTRMRLELALLNNEAAAGGLEEDVMQMEHMINEYLDFAQGASQEETSRLSLPALLADIQQNYARQGYAIHVASKEACDVYVRESAFIRLLTNLMNNAIRYGKHCEVSYRIVAGKLELLIDDDGPGIPEDKREEVMRPFTRLDPARNLNQSGVGLGLAVVQDIAQQHGGHIELQNSPSGGLRVVIRLPVL